MFRIHYQYPDIEPLTGKVRSHHFSVMLPNALRGFWENEALDMQYRRAIVFWISEE